MLKFQHAGKFTIPRLGTVYSIYLDRECNDFDWIIGHLVHLDGALRLVIGVERYAHMPPFRKGESIGLLVGEHGN